MVLPGEIVTVRGPLPPGELGPTLPHEHVLCDFIGAERTGPHRWNRDAVAERMLPLLRAAYQVGVRGFVDCSPAYIARDPVLLRRLAEESGLHILTNTGYYKEPFLPPHAFTEGPAELAARWIHEARHGIEDTGIRPGFLKIAVNPGQLLPIQRKIVHAAVLAQRATGLTIACHTADGPAALETLDLLEELSAPLDRFIVVHSDAIEDRAVHTKLRDRGTWVEYDGIGWRPLEQHLELILWHLGERGPDRLLLSHDAGWYWAGEPGGGEQKPFTPLFATLLPMLRARRVPEATLHRLTVTNPALAFARRPAEAPSC
jgi:phosphotriesterase-related protein